MHERLGFTNLTSKLNRDPQTGDKRITTEEVVTTNREEQR